MVRMFAKLKSLVVKICILSNLLAMPLFAKNNMLIKEEDGYYYGYGSGSSVEESLFNGKKNLIETALYMQSRQVNPKAKKITVSDDCVRQRLPNLKPFKTDKKTFDVVYKIKTSDWDKDENAVQESLRSQLEQTISIFRKSYNIEEKFLSGKKIIGTIKDYGEDYLLTYSSTNELCLPSIVSSFEKMASNIKVGVSKESGFIDASTKIALNVRDENGIPLENIPLNIKWNLYNEYFASKKGSSAEISSECTTDKYGNISVQSPDGKFDENMYAVLSVSIFLSGNDEIKMAEKRYSYVENVGYVYPTVPVPAGTYHFGAVPQDKKAGKKEISKNVKLDDFEMGYNLVTNMLYSSYLFIEQLSKVPDYFGNDNYNMKAQPVIGITYDEAQSFAVWLSLQTGERYRLPSAEEWEAAARAGTDSIYPWGDKDPVFGKNANYSGNGIYDKTSPIGVFSKGENSLGIDDMAGNVWEFTSTTVENSYSEKEVVVKGGSWMDPPSELRISNFKNISASESYSDVGFRLVKE